METRSRARQHKPQVEAPAPAVAPEDPPAPAAPSVEPVGRKRPYWATYATVLSLLFIPSLLLELYQVGYGNPQSFWSARYQLALISSRNSFIVAYTVLPVLRALDGLFYSERYCTSWISALESGAPWHGAKSVWAGLPNWTCGWEGTALYWQLVLDVVVMCGIGAATSIVILGAIRCIAFRKFGFWHLVDSVEYVWIISKMESELERIGIRADFWVLLTCNAEGFKAWAEPQVVALREKAEILSRFAQSATDASTPSSFPGGTASAAFYMLGNIVLPFGVAATAAAFWVIVIPPMLLSICSIIGIFSATGGAMCRELVTPFCVLCF